MNQRIDLNLLKKLKDGLVNSPEEIFSDQSCDERHLYIRSLIEHLHHNSLPTHYTEGVLRNKTFFWRLQNKIKPSALSDSIEFYNIDEPFGFLSNFSEHPVFMNDCIWSTVEHYYQGQKFSEKRLQEVIRLAPSPTRAKEISLSMKKYQRDDWSEIKVEVMKQALQSKFSQHPDLKEALLLTAGKKLVEHTAYDSFWGDGKDGKGKNMLGLLLMEIRDSQLSKKADCKE